MNQGEGKNALETINKTLLGITAALQTIVGQNEQTQRRLDQISLWLTQYFSNTVQAIGASPPPWIPKSKKEITTVVALVVFAMTVLAIVLASCGVIGCSGVH